jgi:hypothetical protein
MNTDFTIEVRGSKDEDILSRMINECTRTLVNVKCVTAYRQDEGRSVALFVINTTACKAFKIQKQFDKIIDVQESMLTEGAFVYNSKLNELLNQK